MASPATGRASVTPTPAAIPRPRPATLPDEVKYAARYNLDVQVSARGRVRLLAQGGGELVVAAESEWAASAADALASLSPVLAAVLTCEVSQVVEDDTQ